MSQHLIDTGRRQPADREDEHGMRAHGDGSGNGSVGRHEGHAGSVSGAGTSQAPAGHDATLGALDALGHALEQMSRDHQLLEERVKELHRQRADGREWRDILADEEPPGTMQVVSRMLACLAKASGTLRKELVDSMRREGVSIPAIAKLFGVTHQRVSNLLRRPTE